MYRKRGDPPTNGASKIANAPIEPGDQQVGEWSRERLVRMNARFVECVERAIATGSESKRAAQATVEPAGRIR
jgi:hypothetical protein